MAKPSPVGSSEFPAATTPWSMAAKLLARWLETDDRIDEILDDVPSTFSSVERGRIQSLVFGVVRNFGRIESHLRELVTNPPRSRLRAILLLAGIELLEEGDEHHAARVVHHAVEQAKTLASPPEARLVNAVVRKLAQRLRDEPVPGKLASAENLARYFSHPEWMVRRWLAQFGAVGARSLLEWNQQPAPVHARWRLPERGPTAEELAWLTPTEWDGFYEVRSGHWPEVEKRLTGGVLYLQDPSTRIAIDLLAPAPGEAVLDLCAAPGGKSLAIADRLRADGAGQTGRVVAVELPGPRIDRLKENLARAGTVDVALLQADVGQLSAKLFEAHALPAQYPAVLLDVPCSNTGVMRHRVDVRWRLQEQDFSKHGRQQLAFLIAASRRVDVRGRLVYSTCSLDAEENECVVSAFLEKAAGRFVLEKSVICKPWEARHDGAAAFLLRRKE